MPRICSFVVLSLVLCIGVPVWCLIARCNCAASTSQIQQTVDRAIAYLQTESRLVEHPQMRGPHAIMCRMALSALSEAERNGYAIDHKYLAETFESLLGSRRQTAGLENLSQSGRPPDPQAARPRVEHGFAVSGGCGPFVSLC